MDPRQALELGEKLLAEARLGDDNALAQLRLLVEKSAYAAPDNELLEIAEFITDLLRRHIRRCLEGN